MSRPLLRSLAALFRFRTDRSGSEPSPPGTEDHEGDAPIQPTVLLSEHVKGKGRGSGWRFLRRPRSADKAKNRGSGRPQSGLSGSGLSGAGRPGSGPSGAGRPGAGRRLRDLPLDGSKMPPERRYLDLGEVGKGGMGSVRRVRDRELMRQVVLKRLHPELSGDPDIVQQFVEEAQITGQLDHPNIVPVHELGRDEHGDRYFSMKLVEGRTLEELVREAGAERCAPDRLVEFLEILVKVCEAVAFAHDRGVIHRDLKPANIMVGEYGQVYVMDWGIASLWRPPTDDRSVAVSRSSETSQLDGPGMLVGTLSYMAPEQAEARHDRLDPRTDVFALGGTLYYLLAGRAPYQCKTRDELLAQALECEPPNPEEAGDGAIVPSRLARIARKAMSRDPDDRYPSVQAMKRDLEGFLRGAWHLPTRTYPAGEAIIVAGEEGDAAYIITEGECVVLTQVGSERTELRRLGPGEVFGETAIFSARPRNATVEAVSEVTVLVVDRKLLTARFELDSWMGRFVSALAERFCEVQDRLHRLEGSSC